MQGACAGEGDNPKVKCDKICANTILAFKCQSIVLWSLVWGKFIKIGFCGRQDIYTSNSQECIKNLLSVFTSLDSFEWT